MREIQGTDDAELEKWQQNQTLASSPQPKSRTLSLLADLRSEVVVRLMCVHDDASRVAKSSPGPDSLSHLAVITGLHHR